LFWRRSAFAPLFQCRQVVRLVRQLTFSGSHPHISDGKTLTPREIVSVVLHGTLREEN